MPGSHRLGHFGELIGAVFQLLLRAVAGVEEVLALGDGDGEFLADGEYFLLQRSVALTGVVALALGFAQGLGDAEAFGAELGDGALAAVDCVLEAGELAALVGELTALGFGFVAGGVALDDDEAPFFLLGLELRAEGGEVVVKVADALELVGHFALGLLELEGDLSVQGLDLGDAGGLVVVVVAQTLDGGHVLVALELDTADRLLD